MFVLYFPQQHLSEPVDYVLQLDRVMVLAAALQRQHAFRLEPALDEILHEHQRARNNIEPIHFLQALSRAALGLFFGDGIRTAARPDRMAPTPARRAAFTVRNIFPEPKPPPISVPLETPCPLKAPTRHILFLLVEKQATFIDRARAAWLRVWIHWASTPSTTLSQQKGNQSRRVKVAALEVTPRDLRPPVARSSTQQVLPENIEPVSRSLSARVARSCAFASREEFQRGRLDTQRRIVRFGCERLAEGLQVDDWFHLPCPIPVTFHRNSDARNTTC